MQLLLIIPYDFNVVIVEADNSDESFTVKTVEDPYAKDPYEAKYQFLIDKREKAGLKLDSHLPKKIVLFASMIALKNDEK